MQHLSVFSYFFFDASKQQNSKRQFIDLQHSIRQNCLISLPSLPPLSRAISCERQDWLHTPSKCSTCSFTGAPPPLVQLPMVQMHSNTLIKQRWGQIGGAAPGHYCPHQNHQNPPVPQHPLSLKMKGITAPKEPKLSFLSASQDFVWVINDTTSN